jgi:hypothetical protein
MMTAALLCAALAFAILARIALTSWRANGFYLPDLRYWHEQNLLLAGTMICLAVFAIVFGIIAL